MTTSVLKPEDLVSEKAQLFGWWCGAMYLVLFGIGIIPMMEFVPPPSPLLDGSELLAKFADNILWLKGGIYVCIIAAVLYVPFSATVAVQVSRMEVGLPVYSRSIVGTGVLNVVAFIICYVLWTGAFYRPDPDPAVLQLVNDTAWLGFIMLYEPLAIQYICIGLAILQNKSGVEVYPRWFGYMLFWTAMLFVPGGFVPFFFEGPMHWGGLIAFWVPVMAFAIQVPVFVWLTYKAVKDHKNHVSGAAGEATTSRVSSVGQPAGALGTA